MAVKTINTEHLIDLADAIREKRGITTTLSFPNDFIEYQGGEIENVVAQDLASYAFIDSGSFPSGVNRYNMTVDFANNTLRTIITLESSANINNYVVKLDNVIVTPEVYDSANNRYNIDIKDIYAPQFNVTHSISISDGTNTFTRSNLSLLSYLYGRISSSSTNPKMLRLCKAMYIYYLAEIDYFS